MRTHILTISLCGLIFCGAVTAQVPRYANVTNDGQIVYAPAVLDMGPIFNGHAAPSGRTWKVFNAPAAEYARRGWLSVSTNAVPPGFRDTGKWEVVSNEVCRITVREPRRFSVYRITAELMELGIWTNAYSYMEQSGLLPLYYTAREFSEDDPNFERGVGIIKAQLDLDDEFVESVLATSVIKE